MHRFDLVDVGKRIGRAWSERVQEGLLSRARPTGAVPLLGFDQPRSRQGNSLRLAAETLDAARPTR